MFVCKEIKKGNITDGLVNIHHCDLSWSPAENEIKDIIKIHKKAGTAEVPGP